MKECPRCHQIKTLSEFGNNKRTKDGKQRYCKICQAEFDHNHYLKDVDKHKNRRKDNQQKISSWFKEYKQTLACSKCGDNRWYVLQFHHIDPDQKDFNVSDLKKRSIKGMLNEIKKCVPLCSNCHTEFHHLEREHNININSYLK